MKKLPSNKPLTDSELKFMESTLELINDREFKIELEFVKTMANIQKIYDTMNQRQQNGARVNIERMLTKWHNKENE